MDFPSRAQMTSLLNYLRGQGDYSKDSEWYSCALKDNVIINTPIELGDTFYLREDGNLDFLGSPTIGKCRFNTNNMILCDQGGYRYYSSIYQKAKAFCVK